MTTDDILRMAREAGMRLDKHSGGFVERSELERFASIATAHEREARQAAQRQVAELQERLNRADAERSAAVLAEREECAKECDERQFKQTGCDEYQAARDCADAIRARGTK